MTDSRAALDELAALSVGAGSPQEGHEPTHYFSHRLWLPGIATTNGQARWGALGLGRTPEGAADQLQGDLTSLPEGQWGEAAQFDQGRNGPRRSDWPTRRVAWDGERWEYDDEALAAKSHIEYADRKNGRKPVVPVHPELDGPLEDILGATYHLVVYQEQVMTIARELAGYSLGRADLLRRAMGKKKKDVLDAHHAEFTAGMTGRGYSAEAAQALWDVLVPFSGYRFNKSHTAGYGVVAFWTAYLKANFPAEYMAALLTSV
ncbi:DNA-directed DNA polymerase [Parafrankia sp. EAN1pec]|nr:DNA-directed DNA polymerase [Frankia sp. EAN1pec]